MQCQTLGLRPAAHGPARTISCVVVYRGVQVLSAQPPVLMHLRHALDAALLLAALSPGPHARALVHINQQGHDALCPQVGGG